MNNFGFFTMNSANVAFQFFALDSAVIKINTDHPRYSTIKTFGMESRCLGVVQFNLG